MEHIGENTLNDKVGKFFSFSHNWSDEKKLLNKLIEKNLPGATAWISDQKNTGASRKNLTHQLKIHNDLSQSHA